MGKQLIRKEILDSMKIAVEEDGALTYGDEIRQLLNTYRDQIPTREKPKKTRQDYRLVGIYDPIWKDLKSIAKDRNYGNVQQVLNILLDLRKKQGGKMEEQEVKHEEAADTAEDSKKKEEKEGEEASASPAK
jgi:hypothetical protein